MQADRGIERRMEELALRAARTGMVQYAWFLSPAQRMQAEICARQADVLLFDEGGTLMAERRVVAFADAQWDPVWPIMCIEIVWNARYGTVGHRDLLGAILALGVRREQVGDIHVGPDRAYVFVLQEMAAYIASALGKAGAVSLRASVMTDWPDLLPSQEGAQLRVTVASLRLDVLVSAAWKLSRKKTSDLIVSGRVQVDYQQTLRADRTVAQGSVVSVRGLGRMRLESVQGTTKKGKTVVLLTRY